MRIIDLRPSDGNIIKEIAALWVKCEGKRRSDIEATIAWIESQCSAPSCISRVALDDAGAMLGWYCVDELSRKIWKMQRAIINIDRQTDGNIWAAFEVDLEEQAHARGKFTMQSFHVQTWRMNKEIFTAAEEIEQVQNFINCLREVNLK